MLMQFVQFTYPGLTVMFDTEYVTALVDGSRLAEYAAAQAVPATLTSVTADPNNRFEYEYVVP